MTPFMILKFPFSPQLTETKNGLIPKGESTEISLWSLILEPLWLTVSLNLSPLMTMDIPKPVKHREQIPLIKKKVKLTISSSASPIA